MVLMAAPPSKMMIVAPVVISQFFERLAFYGLQVTYAQREAPGVWAA